MASKNLRKIQLGKESTPGTAVAATAVWRGLGTPVDLREVTLPQETVGYLGGTDRSYVAKLLAGFTFDEVECTFEQLPFILAGAIKNVTTGSADGAGAGKIYAYTFPTTSKNTLTTFTIEGGDDQQAERLEYAFVESLKISGKPGEALKVSCEWRGRQLATTTFTGALTPGVAEEMLFGNCKLYIDDVGGTLGTTLKSSTLLGFEFEYKSGVIPKFTADGALYFGWVNVNAPEAKIKITFEHDATSVAEKANWRAQTARQIRLLAEGSAITAGTTYSKKTMRLDLAGKWLKFDKIDELDGNDIVTGELQARFNSTANLFGAITVVNTVASF